MSLDSYITKQIQHKVYEHDKLWRTRSQAKGKEELKITIYYESSHEDMRGRMSDMLSHISEDVIHDEEKLTQIEARKYNVRHMEYESSKDRNMKKDLMMLHKQLCRDENIKYAVIRYRTTKA